MKCAAAKDLIPLYIDKACSVGTEQELREHMQGCAECLAQYERMCADIGKNPDESGKKNAARPFKKLRGKLIRTKILMAVGIAAAVFVIGTAAVLAYGEITKPIGSGIGFSPFFQNLEAKRNLQLLADGKIEEYVDTISRTSFSYGDYDEYTAIRESSVKKLTECREKLLEGGKFMSVDEVHSFYGQCYSADSVVLWTEAVFEISDGSTAGFSLRKGEDGLLYISGEMSYSYEEGAAGNAALDGFTEELVYVNTDSEYLTAFSDFALRSLNFGTAYVFGMRFETLGKEYYEKMSTYLEALRRAAQTDFSIAPAYFDADEGCYKTELTLRVTDNVNGKTAVLTKELLMRSYREWEWGEGEFIADSGVTNDCRRLMEGIF